MTNQRNMNVSKDRCYQLYILPTKWFNNCSRDHCSLLLSLGRLLSHHYSTSFS